MQTVRPIWLRNSVLVAGTVNASSRNVANRFVLEEVLDMEHSRLLGPIFANLVDACKVIN